jgi:endo-1,4-beta-xylanase
MKKVMLNFILLLSVYATNAQIQTSKSQKPVVVEAETGRLSKDVGVSNEGKIRFIFPKTNWESWEVPRDTDSMITYQIKFKAPGYYNLYARVKVGPDARKDDSFFVSKGFGLKEIKKQNWICVNELYSWGYTNKDSIVAKTGNVESGVWKWINVTQGFCKPTEANSVYYVSKTNQIVTFQLATREDGLFIDKFAFCPVGYDYTVAELDNRKSADIVK